MKPVLRGFRILREGQKTARQVITLFRKRFTFPYTVFFKPFFRLVLGSGGGSSCKGGARNVQRAPIHSNLEPETFVYKWLFKLDDEANLSIGNGWKSHEITISIHFYKTGWL